MTTPGPREFARALRGQITANGVSFPPPGHSPKDRSGRVLFGPQFKGGFWVAALSPADDGLALRRHVEDSMGIEREGLEYSSPSPIERMQARARLAAAEKTEADDRAARTRRALEIWAEGVDPRGTIVEGYLRTRFLDLPAEIAGHVLRFHPRCPWRTDEGMTLRLPCMVAIMRDVLTAEPRAIHRTLLDEAGRKLDRRMLGPSGGTAIMFDDGLSRPSTLVVGEGIESALSARQLGFGSTWAVGSAGEVERLPVIPGVETLILLQERDKASARAVRVCAERWSAFGHEVQRALPEIGNDMNDALRELRR